MSPVWIMKSGLIGRAATWSSASFNVPSESGLAGLSKPIWLSEICTKENPLGAACADPIRREAGTPPAKVQTTPVPAQAMHSSTRRRLG